jgi:hypothetical protein
LAIAVVLSRWVARRLGRYYRYRLDAIEAWELAGGAAEV